MGKEKYESPWGNDKSIHSGRVSKNIYNQLLQSKTHYPIWNFGVPESIFFGLSIRVRFGHLESSGTQKPQNFF